MAAPPSGYVRFPLLGAALRAIREECLISVMTISADTDLDASNIYRFEAGKSAAPYRVIDAYLLYGGNKRLLYELKIREDPLKYTTHGVKALRYLTTRPEGDVEIEDISKATRILEHTLRGIMRRLAKDGYVTFRTLGKGRKHLWTLGNNEGKPLPGEGLDRLRPQYSDEEKDLEE